MSFPVSSTMFSPVSAGSMFPATGVKTPENTPVDFQQMLMSSLVETGQMEHRAQQNVEGRLLGEDITSAEVYTSLRKADMALKMMMQVRNKLIDAYQEIQQMRM